MTKRRLSPVAERGQMVAIVAISAVALIAMGAFVMDVGSWIRAHRATQSAADASALAAAQALPDNTTTATTIGLDYAGKNDGGVASGDITYSSYTVANDTVTVTAKRTAPGFLSRVIGISSVNLKATAVARAYNLASPMYAAPFGISKSEPFLSGSGCPCYGTPTTFDLNKAGPGGFKVIDIDGSSGGIGQTTLASWILGGYSGPMGLGWYYSDPGAKFNPSQVQSAMNARVNSRAALPDLRRDAGKRFEHAVPGRRLGRLLRDGLDGAGHQRDDHGLSAEGFLGGPGGPVVHGLLRRLGGQARRLITPSRGTDPHAPPSGG